MKRSTSTPTELPTVIPTLHPTNISSLCMDDYSFTDRDGDSCEFYHNYCSFGVPQYSPVLYASLRNRTTGISALTACCICGGGIHPTISPTTKPSSEPTPSPTGETERPTVSPHHLEHCNDFNWIDIDGDDCEFYVVQAACYAGMQYQTQTYFEEFARDGITAREACCQCGGGNGIKISFEGKSFFLSLYRSANLYSNARADPNSDDEPHNLTLYFTNTVSNL